MKRLDRLPAALLACFVAGCSSGPPDDALGVGLTGTAARYPVRSDWIVDKPPEASPARWFTPGFPPLRTLSDAARSPDADLLDGLQAEQKKRNFLNPAADLTAKDRGDFARVLGLTFGTPAAPAVRVASADELKKLGVEPKDAALRPQAEAAKAALGLDDANLARGAAVYRRWCLHCHGPAGGGDGSNAPQLQPLPRDYRQGVFKFVTSGPEASGKPLAADLERTVRKGLDGSMMPAFPNLTDSQLKDVVGYVVFLSVRGECEYQGMKKLIKYNDDFVSVDQEVAGQLVRVLAAWGKAQTTAAVPPENTPSAGDRLASAARGFKVFNEAGCAACHADYGRTLVLKYDSWGGVSQPRNLVQGVYRGGRRGADLYARLYTGIAGAGMPAHKQLVDAAPKADGTPDKLWDVVHFLQALGDPALRRALAEKYQIVVE